jgi:hypothetical protein
MNKMGENLLFVIGLWLYPHAKKIGKNSIVLGETRFY